MIAVRIYGERGRKEGKKEGRKEGIKDRIWTEYLLKSESITLPWTSKKLIDFILFQFNML